jgi:hypothetical protein
LLPAKGESIEQEAVVSPLTAWDNFYVIMGSSAGALTGLTFVVITLVTRIRERSASSALGAFITPTVVHFGAVLLVCAILSAPWPALSLAALLLSLCGLGGAAYGALIVQRMRRRITYQPVPEDWLWFAVLPLVAYIALVVAAILLPGRPAPALFGIGAVMVLLLFVGIHNAWDMVTYIIVERLQPRDDSTD